MLCSIDAGDINGSAKDETAAERKVSAMQIGELKSLSSNMCGASVDLVAAANALETVREQGSKIGIIRQEQKVAESGGVKPRTKAPNLTRDDFPALGAATAANSGTPLLFDRVTPPARPSTLKQNSAPAKTSRPNPPSSQPPPAQPPPGFSAGDLTPTKVSQFLYLIFLLFDLSQFIFEQVTFTSSSGKSFPMSVEPTPQGQHVFLQPADFAQRNKLLITTITDLLGEQQDRFSQFRSLSSHFRSGKVAPNDYYHQCLEIMGEDCFLALFPELLVLLPDIQKQQQLLKVHRSEMRLNGVNQSTEPYVVCATCSQVLSPTDLKHHLSSHNLETHFPALSIAAGGSIDSNQAWSKR